MIPLNTSFSVRNGRSRSESPGKRFFPTSRKIHRYLDRHHYEMFLGSERIYASEVEWNKMTKEDFRYRVEQEPGPFNALGRIKFIFPNNESIYLHDTPATYLFRKNNRHFSHGCVRIQKPVQLARWF